MSAPTRKTRAAVIRRDDGMCVHCGRTVVDPDSLAPVAEYSLQHRRARGMGGSKDPASNAPANLLLLCGDGVTGCHGLVERERGWARREGWAVSLFDDPADSPLHHPRLGWVLVGDTYTDAANHWITMEVS